MTLDSSGDGGYALPIPNQASLLGARIFQQAFVADAGGAALGFAATQGLETSVVNFGVLIGTRSTGKTNQTQLVINLDIGVKQTFSQASQTNVGNAGIYPGSRDYVVMGSGRSNRVALFDTSVFPPTYVKDFGTTLTPWAVHFHPDGQRLYIIEQGPSGSTPEARVVWGNPLLSNFGQDYPGADIALGVQDSLRMEFNSDGSLGILGTLGLFGGGRGHPEVRHQSRQCDLQPAPRQPPPARRVSV